MPIYYVLILALALCLSSCNSTTVPNEVVVTESPQTPTPFNPIDYYASIEDTMTFIAQLKEQYNLEGNYRPQDEAINAFKKINLYGSSKVFYLLEYDFKDGSGASYPYRNQLIMDSTGRLMALFYAQRYELLEVFPGENPFLLILYVTSKGNGGHELYQIEADTMTNVLEANVNTYDVHEDIQVYQPDELTLVVKDRNNDGFNDLSFQGEVFFLAGASDDGIYFDSREIDGKHVAFSIEDPFKINAVDFIFLYNPDIKRFCPKEDYDYVRKLPYSSYTNY